MELTAKAIREVEFREKLRGYHPEDVDAFVEEIAVGIEALQQRLRDGDHSGFSGSMGTAAPPPTDGGAPISEDTLRRTLLMAQRTADLVLSDAQESAAGIISQARSEADALLAESNAQARRIAEETERHAKAAQHDVVADLARMETVREHLSEEIATLGEYLDTQRARIREALLEQLHVLDGQRTQLDPPPVLSSNSSMPNGNGPSARPDSGPSGGLPRSGPSSSMARRSSGSAPDSGGPGSPRPSMPSMSEARKAPVADDRPRPPVRESAPPIRSTEQLSPAGQAVNRVMSSPNNGGTPAPRPGDAVRKALEKPPAQNDVDVFSRGRSPDDVFRHDGDGEDPFLAGLRQARDEPARFDRPDLDRSGDPSNGDRNGPGLGVRSPDGDRGNPSSDENFGSRLFPRR
jgi:DivIVA domain-containing protein